MHVEEGCFHDGEHIFLVSRFCGFEVRRALLVGQPHPRHDLSVRCRLLHPNLTDLQKSGHWGVKVHALPPHSHRQEHA
jgi:hypothetical protein